MPNIQEMKKIAMVVYGLNYGGVERVCIDYMRLLKAKGHEIDLYILNKKEQDMRSEVPEGICIFTQSLPNYICPATYWRLAVKYVWGKYVFLFPYVFFSVVLFFYRLFGGSRKNYDIAIALGGHLNDLTFVAEGFVKADKKVCWLHGALYQYMVIVPGFQFFYQKIKNLVVLSDLAQDECLFFNKHLDLNIRKLYNPSFIASRKVDENVVESIKKKYGDFIVMVARLTPPKNHLGLIRAMEYLYDKYGFEYNVVFVGDGHLKESLTDYASKSPVGKHIFFAGNQSDPQNYYAAAKMFALSTISEGLPTVLVEAAYFGLPLVASQASVHEILGSNENGLVAPIYDDKKLGEHIYHILSNPAEYEKYSQKAKAKYKEFEPERISEQLEDFLNNLK